MKTEEASVNVVARVQELMVQSIISSVGDQNWNDVVIKMKEREEEFDKQIETFERLDLEAKQIAMTYYVK